MKQLYLYIFILTCCYLRRAEPKCAQGYYFLSGGQSTCAPCQDGSYMPDNGHTRGQCLACTKITKEDLEVLVTQCNKIHDTVILCQTGYFRHKARSATETDHCVSCSQCEVLARPCQGYSDSVCCGAGKSCDVNDQGMFVLEESSQPGASYQNEGFHELMITNRDNETSCGYGFFTHTNSVNGAVTCFPCSEIPSRNITSTLCKNCTDLLQLPAECRTKSADNIALAKFRLVGILLFSVAVVVDSLYVFLYARNFLRKNTGHVSRRSCFSVNESRSRMIGTAGIDVHIVFLCIHLFGILCEVGIVNMDPEVLWRFTVCVGVLTVILYFFNAVLFLFVKRLFCAHVCVSYRSQTTSESVEFRTEDVHVFLDST